MKSNEKFEQRLTRALEIIPGVLLWVLLLSPLWAGVSIPIFILNVFLILSVYWLYRALLTPIGLFFGYRRVQDALKKDWQQEIKNLKKEDLLNPEELPDDLFPGYLVVLPNYGEEYPVIQRTIKALMDQNYPKEKIHLCVSIEERKALKDPVYANRLNLLREEFGEFFGDRLFLTAHPGNIPGEVPGAASNRKWGTKYAVEQLESQGKDISKFLITAPDGDLVFHKEYLASSAYKWIMAEKRNQKFYQTALYTFNNNYWEVPILIRIVVINLTLPVLASSVIEKHKRETWSCFTLNLDVMKKVDYWDASLSIDDTPFYWRPFAYFNGDWECEVFYVPLSADAIYDESYVENHRAQYKQYLRWGWGVVTFPLAIKMLLNNKEIPLSLKITKVYQLLEIFVFWKVLAFLISLGIPIVLFLNRDLSNYVYAYTFPSIVSSIMSLALLGMVPAIYYKYLLVPPRPANMSRLKYLFLLIIEAPMNVITLFTFSFIPFIVATTGMMLGQRAEKKIKWSEKKLAN